MIETGLLSNDADADADDADDADDDDDFVDYSCQPDFLAAINQSRFYRASVKASIHMADIWLRVTYGQTLTTHTADILHI